MKSAEYYRKKFARTGSNSSLESLEESSSSDFTESEIPERLNYSKDELYRIIEKYLDNDPALKEIADKIVKDSTAPLQAVADNNDEYLDQHPEETSLLEVIVQTDGSRPSFLVRNGNIDFDSSPVGEWELPLLQMNTLLRRAFECVGRINIGEQHAGTGFLIHRNLVVTNRHVLQAIALQGTDGTWTIHPGANIDFGFEYKARLTRNRRRLKKLIYCGPQFIDRRLVDHSKLDIALLEAEPVPDDMVPGEKDILQWDATKTWAWPDTMIFTIGYPGDPGLKGIENYTEPLLDKLFKRTFGQKRIAPGRVMEPIDKQPSHMVAHDATTLAGNSGSILLLADQFAASGLHYGGDLAKPRQNWGHVLGNVLSVKSNGDRTLLEYLEENNVGFINTNAS